jgi:hypothetical protein
MRVFSWLTVIHWGTAAVDIVSKKSGDPIQGVRFRRLAGGKRPRSDRLLFHVVSDAAADKAHDRPAVVCNWRYVRVTRQPAICISLVSLPQPNSLHAV